MKRFLLSVMLAFTFGMNTNASTFNHSEDDTESFGWYTLGFYSYKGGENYSAGGGRYELNGFGLGFNVRSNLKFKDHQLTLNWDLLPNYSFGVYNNSDIKVLVTPEIGPSFASRFAIDDGEAKSKFYVDGFMGLKATVVYHKIMISAGYHLWAPEWKFGKEKADGFYAQIGICIN